MGARRKDREGERAAIPYAPVTHIGKRCAEKLMPAFEALSQRFRIIDEDNMQDIREEWEKTHSSAVLFSQKGGQTDMPSSPADISIEGGGRGGGKSYVLLMNALYDITNPNFRAIIFRKDLDDLSDLIDTSQAIYGAFVK